MGVRGGAGVCRAVAVAVLVGLGAVPGWGYQMYVNEFYRGPGTFEVDEWMEIVLLEDVSATTLQSIYFGDSQTPPTHKNESFRLKNLSAIATTFKAGTIIVIGGPSNVLLDTSYDTANGDWNLAFPTTNTTYTQKTGTGSMNLTSSDVVWLDTVSTGSNLTIDGFSVHFGTADYFSSGAVTTLSGVTDGSAAALMGNLASASTAANWQVGIALASATPGQPNGGANTTYINGLRGIVNQPPVLDTIGDRSISEGQTLSFVVNAVDPDAAPASLVYTLDATSIAAGASLNASSGQFTWTPTFDQAGPHVMTITVSDNAVPPLTDFETITVTVIDVPDRDGDGVDDADEDAGPNGGDSNGDSIPDRNQPGVTVVRTSPSSVYTSLQVSSGSLAQAAITGTIPAGLPTGATAPAGLASFTINGVGNGGSTNVTLTIFGTGLGIDALYKHQNGIWSLVPTASIQTQVDRVVITYSLTDGGALDADGLANGVIVDPVAPVSLPAGVGAMWQDAE